MTRLPVTVLASGGVDSTACIAYYRDCGNPVRALWVDYGQPPACGERRAIRRVARHYRTPLTEVALRGIPWRPTDDPPEFPARNLTLAALGLNSHHGAGLVALGVHAGSPFPDCSQAFAKHLDALARLLTDGRMRVDCPFVDWQKDEILAWARQAAVPLDATYSCLVGPKSPCGVCTKCRERAPLPN